MIEIEANDGVVLLRPLDHSCMEKAAELYNSSPDMRFATGYDGRISVDELDIMLHRIHECTGDFAMGIYIKENKNFAGLISGVLHERTVWVKLLAILPQFRLKGYGRRSIDLIFQCAKREFNISEAFLSVIEKNDAGVTFWKSQGFIEVRRILKELYNEKSPYNVIIMHKKL